MRNKQQKKKRVIINGTKYMFFCWPLFSVLVLLFCVLSVLIPIIKINMIEKLVDTLVYSNSFETNCYTYVTIFSGVLLFEFVLQSRSFLDYFGAHYQKRFVKKYYKRFLKSCMDMPYQNYESLDTCNMIEKVKTFFKNDFSLMMITFYRIIVIATMTIATLIKIGNNNVVVVVFLCVITVIILLLKTILAYKNMLFKNSQIQISRKIKYLFELFTNKNSIAEMNIYNHYSYLIDKRESTSDECLLDTMNNFDKHKKIQIMLEFILSSYVVVAILILFYGSYNDPSLSPGVFLALAYTIQQFQSNIDSLAQRYNLVYDFMVISNDMHEFIDSNTEVDKPQTKDVCFQNMLEMKNISFSYLNSNEEVLKDINLSINKGDKIAIVGENGAGKTTLVKVLVGLYNNYQGSIYIDNYDLRNISIDSYYRLFGCVFQDFNHYLMSFKDNILLGKCVDNEKKIESTIKRVGLDNVLGKTESGISTMLGKEFGGYELSGGEWQKIAISRAVFRDSEIMVFDEPTSALDPIAEYEIFQNMFSLFADKTLIFISHRLASTKFVDKIVYMENGQIVEFGSHEQLMNNDGKYASLYKEQQQWYQRSTIEDKQNDNSIEELDI